MLTDKEKRIVVILAGRPQDDRTWDETMKGVRAALELLDEELQFGDSQVLPKPSHGSTENWRGQYKTAAFRVSYGGGQTVRRVILLLLLQLTSFYM